MKKIQLLLIILTIYVANGQSSDVLIWNSDTLKLYSNPLELRTDWEQINDVLLSEIEEDRLFKKKDSVIELIPWQNYQTKWIIKNDSLYLKDITSIYKSNYKLGLHDVFGNESSLLFANWVDKNLITYSGDCIKCTGNHFKNTSVYENETVLQFEKGILSKATDYVNNILRKYATLFSNPNEYLDFIYKKIDWKTLPELKDEQYQVFVSITPNKNGKLKNIDWENTFLIFNDTILQDKENPFIKESIRIAKQITDWEVVIRQENILNQQLSIVFNEKMEKKYAR